MDYPVLGITIHEQGDTVEDAPQWARAEDGFLNCYLVRETETLRDEPEFFKMPLTGDQAINFAYDIFLYAKNEISPEDVLFLKAALQEKDDKAIKERFK